MELKNKVVIVTGASSGIGLATARLFSEKGAKVVLVSRSKDKLNAISKNLENSIVVPADLTKEKDIMNMINKAEEYFGRIDILVNNAGRGYDAPVEKTDIETFRYIFNLDVIGPLIAMQNVIPIMRRNKGGHIINISSGTALMYLPNTAAYSSSKRALASISLTAVLSSNAATFGLNLAGNPLSAAALPAAFCPLRYPRNSKSLCGVEISLACLTRTGSIGSILAGSISGRGTIPSATCCLKALARIVGILAPSAPAAFIPPINAHGNSAIPSMNVPSLGSPSSLVSCTIPW